SHFILSFFLFLSQSLFSISFSFPSFLPTPPPIMNTLDALLTVIDWNRKVAVFLCNFCLPNYNHALIMIMIMIIKINEICLYLFLPFIVLWALESTFSYSDNIFKAQRHIVAF